MHCIVPIETLPWHTGETTFMGFSLCDLHLDMAWSVWDNAVQAGDWETMTSFRFLMRLLKKVRDG